MAQNLEEITDPEAYAVYAAVVPGWSGRFTGSLVLQRETSFQPECRLMPLVTQPEWIAVENNFKQENARTKLLQSSPQLNIPYRLISRAEIEADDAKLAAKYPDILSGWPEAQEYVTVSAVGFNSDKTKAIVSTRMASKASRC